MTEAEKQLEQERAEELAASIGGALAVILGLRADTVRWDADTASFIFDGRRVSNKTIRRELGRIETGVGYRIAKLTDRLARKEISLSQWQDQFTQLVSSSHVLMAAIGSGSIAAALSKPIVGQNIASELKYAENFAKDIEKKKLSAPTIKARGKGYLLGATLTYATVQIAVKQAAGMIEARRVRTARESCRGCIDAAGSWMPIADIPEIGSLQCRSKCRCYLEYR